MERHTTLRYIITHVRQVETSINVLDVSGRIMTPGGTQANANKKRGKEWDENTRCISEEHRKKRLDECE